MTITSIDELRDAKYELYQWYESIEFPCSDEEFDAANLQIPILESAIRWF